MTATAPVDGLVMVYDADGTLAGEVRYVVGHILGRAHCDLCDITHGPLRRKAAFDGLVERLPVPVEVLHRDQQDATLRAFTEGRLACVVARTGSRLEVLVTREELAACAGSVESLGALLEERLATRTEKA